MIGLRVRSRLLVRLDLLSLSLRSVLLSRSRLSSRSVLLGLWVRSSL
jgi:hypothetical protein